MLKAFIVMSRYGAEHFGCLELNLDIFWLGSIGKGMINCMVRVRCSALGTFKDVLDIISVERS